MNKKIFITGTSGIGKTTLAKYLAEKNNIPFIVGSSKVLWEKYGIRNHQRLLELGIIEPQTGLAFQYDLLDIRNKAVEGLDSFVTDRSVVDNLVYFMFQNAPYLSEKDTRDYIRACKVSLGGIFDWDYENLKLIYLSRNFFPFDKMAKIEDDGARIDNPYYQDMMDTIFQSIFDKKYLESDRLKFNEWNYIKIRDYNWETRTAISENFLEHNPTWLDKLFM